MLPKPDQRTLSRYLLSAAESIHSQINQGLSGDIAQRLRECAAVTARVAQQLEQAERSDWTVAEESEALIAGEVAFAQAETGRQRAGLEKPATSTRQIAPEQVETYLRAHPLGGSNLHIQEARLLSGGRCKLTALITQDGAAALPISFILRQDWQGGATDTTVSVEHELLTKISAAGIRAPRSLLLEAGHSVVGEPFILVERMPGQLHGGLFAPPPSRKLALQFAEQIARLHSLPPADFGDPDAVISARRAQIAEGIAQFREMQATIGIRSRVVDRAIDWVDAHRDAAGDAIALTHNDLGFHNSLVEGDELTAILDWELARLGHPAEDIGYIRHFIPQMMPWEEFIDAYQRAGGWQVEQRALDFHTIWSALRLHGLIMQARAALAGDIVRDIEIAYAVADNGMQLLEFLARILCEAED